MFMKCWRRYVVFGEFCEFFLDGVCVFVLLERYVLVDSGVDMMDNVDNGLFCYRDRCKVNIGCVIDFFLFRIMIRSGDNFVLLW